MMSSPERESHLLSIVEVSHANRVRCQADGCGHSVFKRIHVVLDNGKFHVLGSQCFTKLYGGLGTAVAPYYGGGSARPLTDDERAMLVENTALFIEQLENERIEFERVAAILEAERQQEEREKNSVRQKHATRIYEVYPASTSSQYRYIWSSSWWKSSVELLENVRVALSWSVHVSVHANVIYKAIVETVRQPTISPAEFATRLATAGVPREVTLRCLCDLKLAVRGKTV